MKLRVKEHVPIPHNVIIPKLGEVSFSPEAEVPDEWAEARLKDQSHVYEKAEGKVDVEKYRMRSSSQVEALHDLFDQLTEKERAIMISNAKAMLEKRRKAAELAAAKADDEAKKAVREKEEEEARLRKEGKV